MPVVADTRVHEAEVLLFIGKSSSVALSLRAIRRMAKGGAGLNGSACSRVEAPASGLDTLSAKRNNVRFRKPVLASVLAIGLLPTSGATQGLEHFDPNGKPRSMSR